MNIGGVDVLIALICAFNQLFWFCLPVRPAACMEG